MSSALTLTGTAPGSRNDPRNDPRNNPRKYANGFRDFFDGKCEMQNYSLRFSTTI
jgi:hypothetical protein